MFHLLLAAIYLAFIGLGLPDGLLGAAWPAMRADSGFSGFSSGPIPISHSGIVFAIISICTVFSSLQSDRITRKFGAGRVTAVSTAITAISILGFASSSSMSAICLWAIPYGLGAGSIDAALNNYVALHFASRHMSWLHCMWGVGASLGPYVMGTALSNGFSWQKGYLAIGIAQVAITAAMFASLPLWKTGTMREGVSPAQIDKSGKALSLPAILRIKGAKPILACFFCYCAIEQTSGLWAASFLANLGVEPAKAAFYASMVYLGITIGRGIGGFATFKWNDNQMLRIGEGLIVIGVALVALPVAFSERICADIACIGFVILGFGCAPVYPSIIHSTPDHFGSDKSQAIIGVQMAFAYMGTTCMPPLFGFVAKRFSTSLLPLYIFALLLSMALLYERVVRATSGNACSKANKICK